MIEMLYQFRDLLFLVFSYGPKGPKTRHSPSRTHLEDSEIGELKEAETNLFSGVTSILTSAIRKVESSLTQDGDLGVKNK